MARAPRRSCPSPPRGHRWARGDAAPLRRSGRSAGDPAGSSCRPRPCPPRSRARSRSARARGRLRYGSSRWRAICSQVSVTWPSASMISKLISISPLSSQPSPRCSECLGSNCGPLPRDGGEEWSGLGLVLPGLLDDGGAVEAIDLLEERARVEVGRGHRAFDDLLVLEDALELVPLGEGADAEPRIRAVDHSLQGEPS